MPLIREAIVTTVNALLQRVPPRAWIAQASFLAKVGQDIDHEALVTFLAGNGYVRAGTVRALAVSSAERSPTFPDIPTIAETYPQVVTTNWFGFAGPAGVPEEIVTRMHAEVARALKSPFVIERLSAIGVQPGGDPPDQTQAFVLAEIERWAKVVTETGTKMN